MTTYISTDYPVKNYVNLMPLGALARCQIDLDAHINIIS
jgi:hypothetical protein